MSSPSLSRVTRIWITYTAGMTIYGFSRGYRATHDWDSSKQQFIPYQRQRLLMDRVGNGCSNAIYYAVPFIQPWILRRLISRIEIQLRGWKPEDYHAEYNDGIHPSYCLATL